MKRLAIANVTAAVLIFAVLSLCGCNNPYRATLKVCDGIATGVTQGNNTADELRMAQLITPAEEVNVLGYLKFVGDANGAFAKCATAVNSKQGANTTFTSCAATFQTTLQNPQEEALVHVTNPNAQQKIDLIADAFTSAASTLIAALGGQ